VTTGIFPPDVGGPARFVPEISKKLSLNHDITVVTYSNKPFEEFEYNFKVLRLNRNSIKFIRFLKTIKAIYKFGKDVDLIFVNGLWLEVYITNILLKKRIYRKVVGDPVWEKFNNKNNNFINFDKFQNEKKNFYYTFLTFLRNNSFKSSDLIIVPSDHLKLFVRKAGYNGKIIQINNGTKITEYNEEITDNNFLIVSRLVKHKNIDLVIKAFKKINDNLSLNFKLHIVGDGPEYKNLENLIKKLNLTEKIFLTGKKNEAEVEKYYKEAKFFIQASSYEGSPHSILEAINYHNFVIASNFGGVVEILSPNYSELIPLEQGMFNPETLYNILENTLTNNLSTKSKTIEAKNNLINHYNINNTINSYIKLFDYE
ncbi:MAG: glycosyltransferase family 4 protein, partial [Pelagibacteraceae bacterium]